MAYIDTIGTRIMELRKKTGMTQADLARRMHLTRSSINSWEQEITCPSIDSLCSLAQIFHVSVDYLVGLSGKMTINIEPYSEREKKLILDLLQYFDESRQDHAASGKKVPEEHD